MKKLGTESNAQDNNSIICSEDIRLLSALGFMSARQGYIVPAIRIFEALTVLRPTHTFPYVGLALANLYVGNSNEAAHILLNRGLKACPEDPEIHLYLSLALQTSGFNKESEIVADTLIHSSEIDESQLQLARLVSDLAKGKKLNKDWPQPALIKEISETETS